VSSYNDWSELFDTLVDVFVKANAAGVDWPEIQDAVEDAQIFAQRQRLSDESDEAPV